MKIAIIGYSGSGKSTLAKQMGVFYGIPVLYLDRVQFTANWKERDRNEAHCIVCEFMRQPSWVIDGNYTAFLQDERLEHADHIIFMNFSRFNCLWRALKRYFKYRNTYRESAADGCIEKIDFEFLWWLLYDGRTKKRHNSFSAITEKYKSKTTVLKNQKQLNIFIEKGYDNTRKI